MGNFQIVVALLGILSSGSAQSIPAGEKTRLPLFEDFKVHPSLPARKGIAFVARPELETQAEFHRRLRDAAKEGPDFAGRYVIERWGCGSNCEVVAIVDTITGKVYEVPFGVAGGLTVLPENLLSYRLDSRLLVVTGSLEMYDEKDPFNNDRCGRFYYVWSGRQLRLLKSVPFPCGTNPDKP